jgi:Cof subfamily protein (haloacid dehalogenase superfamily)
MLVMDMDYTLLNKEKVVSERNKEAIRKAKEKGVIVVVATGRLYTSAMYYAKLLEIETPVIASNGAIIREHHTNRTLYQNLLPNEVAYKMVELCKKAGLYCHIYTMDTIYSEKLINISYRYTQWNEVLKEEDKIKIQIVPELEKLILMEEGNILKAVVMDNDKDKIQFIRDEIIKTNAVSVSQSLKDNIEVMNMGVSKGNSVRILAEMYGIKREEIVAIGDNENDISMIEYAGLGIAMENGVDKAKAAAKYVTSHHDKDGVADAIEKFIL